jgi:hypothetical protein
VFSFDLITALFDNVFQQRATSASGSRPHSLVAIRCQSSALVTAVSELSRHRCTSSSSRYRKHCRQQFIPCCLLHICYLLMVACLASKLLQISPNIKRNENNLINVPMKSGHLGGGVTVKHMEKCASPSRGNKREESSFACSGSCGHLYVIQHDNIVQWCGNSMDNHC